MEVTIEIILQQLLTVVKTLTPAQKARLKRELVTIPEKIKKTDFTELLLSGPVFTEKQIKTIEENRKSIAKWQTLS